jgi:hypothetical protein
MQLRNSKHMADFPAIYPIFLFGPVSICDVFIKACRNRVLSTHYPVFHVSENAPRKPQTSAHTASNASCSLCPDYLTGFTQAHAVASLPRASLFALFELVVFLLALVDLHVPCTPGACICIQSHPMSMCTVTMGKTVSFQTSTIC